MVSQKDITDLDFAVIGEYFDYIIESEINGNGQVDKLIKKLSKDQKKDFIKHCDSQEECWPSDTLRECKDKTLKLL